MHFITHVENFCCMLMPLALVKKKQNKTQNQRRNIMKLERLHNHNVMRKFGTNVKVPDLT